jgi:hypothetical protein
MMNARAFEERSVTQDRSLLVAGIHRQTFEWDLLTVYVHHKMDETEITKAVRVLYLFFHISSSSVSPSSYHNTSESPTFFAAIGNRH